MGTAMMTPTLSPLRDRLCSRKNADLVARRLQDDGIRAFVTASNQPLQPWRVVEHDSPAPAGVATCA